MLHLHTEQSPVSTHAQLVPLLAIVGGVAVAGRVWDSSGVDHDRAVQDDAVLLNRENFISVSQQR